ncbi:MAG: LPS translocon maturation chaperone LptM [Azonexus sp.]
MSRLAPLLLAFGLAACGMKGPLELPPKATQATKGTAEATAPQGGDGSTPAPSSSSASKDPKP